MSSLKKNFFVDLLLYIGFVLLLATGLILQYILPHGSGRLTGSGTGQRAGEKIIAMLWGMTREQWGEIHFWIAVGILVITLLHLVLHWRWIVCVLRRRKSSPDVSGGRAVIGLAGFFGLLAIIVVPFLTPVEKATRNQIIEHERGMRSADTGRVSGSAVDLAETHDESIRGSMTLREVQESTGVPYTYILQKLGLTDDISPDENLGRLRKKYGFSIEEVRRIVSDYLH